jgi:hypothetical protein
MPDRSPWWNSNLQPQRLKAFSHDSTYGMPEGMP